MRSPSHLVAPVAALLLLAHPSTVRAQTNEETAGYAKTLQQGRQPKSRVMAAGHLAESEDPEALAPLCAGLGDPEPEVRTAVAAALAKLQEPGAVECLEARKEEPEEAVRAANASALRSLQELVARPARLYVVLDEVRDMTKTLPPELIKLTEARMRRKLFLSGAMVAPPKESEAVHKRKLPGYRLTAQIVPGAKDGLKIQVLCQRYPEKKMLGSVDVQASDAPPVDLLSAMAPRVIEEALESIKSR